MIPQFLHWVLPYGAELNREQQMTFESWRAQHPSWRPLIWAADPGAVAGVMADLGFEVRALPLLLNHQLYSFLGGHGDPTGERNTARALIAIVEIVARYGGICPPIEEPCVGNIESLLQGVRLFTRDDSSSGDTRTSPSVHPLFGAMPNHPALWNMVRELKNSVSGAPMSCAAVSAASLAELVQSHLEQHPDNIAFPAAAFEVNSCSTL